MKKISLRLLILLPLTIALMLMIAGFIFDAYITEKNNIDLILEHHSKTVPHAFEKGLQDDANMMIAIIETLNSINELKIAFRANNKERLLDLSKPLFEKLKLNHNITHFYFTDPHRVNLLRVHKPDKYGDTINRYTTLSAEKTGKVVYGIELGTFGTFTLCVVQPLYDEKGLIGYLELGQEIDHIIPRISATLGLDFYITINKKYLVRDKWVAGMNMLGHDSDWDQLPDDVLIAQTLEEIPENLFGMNEEHEHGMANIISTSMKNGKRFKMIFIPLRDVKGNKVGDIIISVNRVPAGYLSMKDITKKLMKKEGKKIKLKLDRDGKKIKVSFRLRDLL